MVSIEPCPGFCPARHNPFASEHLRKIRYRFLNHSLTSLLNRFEILNRRAAIVGPQGHGKTTLQKELADAITSATSVRTYWVKLREGDRKIPRTVLDELFSQAGEFDLICVDGAEQLSWWNWKKFLRQLGKEQGCLITSHRAGLLPTLTQCTTSLSLLSDLVTELASAPDAAQQKELEAIYNRHRGDIRQSIRELYDRCSDGLWNVSRTDVTM